MASCPKNGMIKLRKERGNKCAIPSCDEKCEDTDPVNLQFCHIRDTPIIKYTSERKWEGRGQGNRYYDIKKHPRDYILLCIRHHRAFDAEEISLEGVPLFPEKIPIKIAPRIGISRG